MSGRPAAVHAPASGRVSAASLRPYLIPACVRASAAEYSAGLRPYLIPASGGRGRLNAVQVSCFERGGGVKNCQSLTRKIRDPLRVLPSTMRPTSYVLFREPGAGGFFWLLRLAVAICHYLSSVILLF